MINRIGLGIFLSGAVLTLESCQKSLILPVAPSPIPTIQAIAPSPVISSVANRKASQKYRQLGLNARQRGNYTEAIEFLEKAANLDPNNFSGRVLLGWTLHLMGKETDATQTLQNVLEQDPTNIPALNALGIVYLVSGNLTNAVKIHQQAVSLNDKNEIAHYNLALAYQRLQEFELALFHAQKATQLEPNNPHTWVAIALVYWDKGDKAKAKKMYQQAINLDSRYRQSDFLSHLKLAGLSPDQIQLTRAIQNY